MLIAANIRTELILFQKLARKRKFSSEETLETTRLDGTTVLAKRENILNLAKADPARSYILNINGAYRKFPSNSEASLGQRIKIFKVHEKELKTLKNFRTSFPKYTTRLYFEFSEKVRRRFELLAANFRLLMKIIRCDWPRATYKAKRPSR